MTASRGSYEVSLITEKDRQWKLDKSQKHCYVCTKVKLTRGKRHHCRLCGNISCPDCCPRICKKCLAENISSSSSSSSISDGTVGQIQRLCKLKSQQIAWKRVEMIDKIYYEPVFIVNQDATKICIVRNVEGDYYAVHKDILFAAPEKQNILDSLQCLLHAFINRSSESSISLKKALYALHDDNSNINTSQILKRCHIFSFYPMLQAESYKLQGFIFKSSLNKMNLNNVQLFHFVSDEESPKKIPAYTATATDTVNKQGHTDHDDEKQPHYNNHNENVIISANSRRKSADSLKKRNMAILELELESFKKGYQEMRKMYEEYVSANEVKLKENKELIERLQNEVEDLSQSQAKYKQAVDINANQVTQLQQELNILSSQYQNKLDAQSNKYKDSTQKTTTYAQAKLIESYQNMEEANKKIRNMETEIETLKTLKTSNKMEEVHGFRLEKEQERCQKLEIKLQALQASIEFNKNDENKNENEGNNGNESNFNVREKIAGEYKELFSTQHKGLFDLLFSLITSYRSTWNKQYLYPLIYELLFNVLLASFKLINKFEKNMSLTLCTQLSINKNILYESFYNEWIKNSNYEIFLHSTQKVKDIKNHLIDEIFMKQFIFKHLNLSSHQISEQIHLEFAVFVDKCINISWQMSIQYPMLRFTPKTFNVEQLNKVKFHKDLHHIYHGEDLNENKKQFILYYIWPIISHNNFHSIMDDIKIQVCLGDSLPNKINSNGITDRHNNDMDANGNPDIEDNNNNDDDDSLGMVIFEHDDNYNNNGIIGDDDRYYEQQDEY